MGSGFFDAAGLPVAGCEPLGDSARRWHVWCTLFEDFMRRIFSAVSALAGLVAVACGPAVWPLDTYCQSGPKYGTHCMSLTDVRAQRAQRPAPPNEPNIGSPSPSPWSPPKPAASPVIPAAPVLTRAPGTTGGDAGAN